jgi:hypothetical protein
MSPPPPIGTPDTGQSALAAAPLGGYPCHGSLEYMPLLEAGAEFSREDRRTKNSQYPLPNDPWQI